MDIYVLTAPEMSSRGHRGCVQIFSSQSLAAAYATSLGQPRAKIEHHVLSGEYSSGDVFAAHTYHKPSDEFDFLGVFMDYDSARRAAGDPNLILKKTIDPPLR